jgi:hypothetical protein
LVEAFKKGVPARAGIDGGVLPHNIHFALPARRHRETNDTTLF